jgi:hypothetical protein
MINRRQFIGSMAGLSVAALAGLGASTDRRKLIIVQFGGGVRCSETIDESGRKYIPHLWKEMVPRGTLFTNMRVDGKVVHPNSTGSIVTGHWEWDDLDWSKPVKHPTIFEIHRKATGAPDTKAWAFVYASILAKAGESQAGGFGANVVEPPTIPRSSADEMNQLMSHAAATGLSGAELDAAAKSAALARSSSQIARTGLRSDNARAFLDRQYAKWKSATGTTSHDAFLTDCALAAMREFAPDVMLVAMGEIDCAHYGSWSRYTDAIRRTDELTWKLWRATEELTEYRGRTLMLVLPDHGRELEESSGTGFIHHSDFYANKNADEGCRRVWMLALGLGVARGRTLTTASPITAAAGTGLEFLGLKASPGAAASVLRLVQ